MSDKKQIRVLKALDQIVGRPLVRWTAGLLTTAMLLAFPMASSASTAAQRIMVYGDSLSAAYGIDPKDGWVSLMQGRLKSEGVEVINSSASGETSTGGLSRIKTDLAMVKPSIVVLALGANDALRGLPTAETRKNLQGIISAVIAAKAKVVLVGIQIPPNYGIEYAQQFRDLYGELAKKNHSLLVPFLLEGVADKLELFQADRLHPKAEAQARIMENVLPVVKRALPPASPSSAKKKTAP